MRVGTRAHRWSRASLGEVAFTILVLAVFAFLALPIFSHKSARSETIKSLANAKHLGLSCKRYAADHDGEFPRNLDDLFPTYLQDRELLVCRLDGVPTPLGYDYFGGREDDPHRVLLRSQRATNRDKCIVVYVDDSAEVVKN